MEKDSENEIIIKSYGEVLKELREKKHISQKVSAGGKRAQGNLSKFEKGGSIPSADTFFRYLRNMKVTPGEYFNAFNNYLLNKDVHIYLEEVFTAYTSKDTAKLRDIILKLEMQEENSQGYDNSFLERIMVEAILSRIDPDFKIAKSSADKIRNYLMTTKYWGHYELRLLSFTTTLFDFVQLAEISERILYFADQNEVSPDIKRQIILCEMNILDSFLLQRQLTLAKKVILHLQEYSIPEDFFYAKANFVYFTARYDYLSGNEEEKKKALVMMETHFSNLVLYGCHGTATLCREEIDNLLNEPESRLFPYDHEDETK